MMSRALSESERQEASDALLAAERDRTQIRQLSQKWPEITIEDSYDIAARTIKTKVNEGSRVRGRKVGLTSKAMQRASQIEEPDYGTLLEDMFIEDGEQVPHDHYCLPRVELELAFTLGEVLRGPGVTLTDVLRATEYVIPSIEIIDTRLLDPRKIYDTVADNGAAAGVVLGGRPMRPQDLDFAWVGGVMYRNAGIEETGISSGVLGHPALGVAWLANKLAEFDDHLEAGEIILSGSFIRPVWADPGDTLRADFGALGNVSVQLV